MREVDYRALRYLMVRTEGPALAKQLALKRFDKAWRGGRLHVPEQETQQQKWWRCEARFLLGDYSDWGGWQYRSEWANRVWFENPFKCPIWDGKHVKRLGIVSEQGLGDEVFFSSMVPDLLERVDSVTMEIEPRLCSAIARSFGIQTVGAKMRDASTEEGYERVMRDPAEHDCDAWATIADVARVFRHKDADFHRRAYLKADDAQVKRFAGLRGRVGISWRGAQGEASWQDWLREFPNAVSLQYDQGWDEDVERPDVDSRSDIEGILGVLANLDRVVCVSTTVAHFASAMGVPTEVRLARYGSGRRSNLIPWKWVNRKHTGETLWYPKTTRTIENADMARAA